MLWFFLTGRDLYTFIYFSRPYFCDFMTTTRDVNASTLIKAAAEELKSVSDVAPPVWAAYVKTGVQKQRIPAQKDWWYMRAAALLRRVYIRPIGVSRLRTIYGGTKRMGNAPARFKRGSGAVIRKALQQLEKAGYIKKSKKGREITAKGQKFLDAVAKSVEQAGQQKQAKQTEQAGQVKQQVQQAQQTQ